MSDCCPDCLRRSQLLEALGARLDHRRRDVHRLWELLQLSDERLIEAIGGRRRAQLHEAYDSFGPTSVPSVASVASFCRHSERFPTGLTGRSLAPPCLHVQGPLDGVRAALDSAVAIVGAEKASDHCMAFASTLAHDLAASGVEVASTLSEGIGSAALQGALAGGGRPVALAAGGVERSRPASCAAVHRRLAHAGWLVSELPCGARSRAWSGLARGRTLVLATSMTVVVELSESAPELSWARLASDHGKTLAAVPGRVGSPGAGGPNELIRDGAVLVRDAQDVLEALYGVSAPASLGVAGTWNPSLPARLRSTFEAVLDGEDTLAKLLDEGQDRTDTVLALAELEALGLLVRGDGGRYVARLRRAAR